MAPAQLPLPLAHPPEYGRETFFAGPSNSAALQMIERWPDWSASVVVLSGPGGSGKTHLANIWAERSGAGILGAAELALGSPTPEPRGRGIVVEDVRLDDVPQQALFHLINNAKEAGTHLLITSRTPASEWRIDVPDLRSRLRVAAPLALAEPDDDLLRNVLVKLFVDRQLTIEKSVLDYLLVRTERSLNAARRLVDALDKEGLASGRRITRPLAARIVAELAGGAEEFTETQ